MSINTCRREALKAQTGLDGHLNDMELAYLQNNGATSNNLNDAWVEVLVAQGIARRHINDMMYEWLGNLGATAPALTDRLRYFWCDLQGAGFGPAAIITKQSGGSCQYQLPATDCKADSTYAGSGVNLVGPITSYLWEVVSGNVTIAGVNNAATVDITSTSGSNEPFQLRLTISDGTNNPVATRNYTHTHTDVTTLAFVGPDIPDQNFILNTPYTLDVSGLFAPTPDGYQLVGDWPAGFAIDSNGVITGTVTEVASYPNLSVRASLAGDPDADSNVFNGEAIDAILPDFHALYPDETTGEMKGVLVGTGDLTTTHADTIYAKDYLGVYRPFWSDEPVYEGGRYASNVISNSADPDQAGWSTDGGVVVSGETVTEGTGSSRHRVYNYIPLSGDLASFNNVPTTGLMRAKIKDVDCGYAVLAINQSSQNGGAVFNLTTGTVVSLFGSSLSGNAATISGPDANGYYDATVNVTFTEGACNPYVAPSDGNAGGSTYTGTGKSVMFKEISLHLEPGEHPSMPVPEYVPTIGSIKTAVYTTTGQVENVQPYSYDATQWHEFSDTTHALDQPGLDGTPNMASSVTDDATDAAEKSVVNRSGELPIATNDFIVWRTLIKRDPNALVHPGFQWNNSGWFTAMVNLKTGETYLRSDNGRDKCIVYVYDDYLEVLCYGELQVALDFQIYPAWITDANWGFVGNPDNSLTNTLTVYSSEIYVNTPLELVAGQPPVLTNGAATIGGGGQPIRLPAVVENVCEWSENINNWSNKSSVILTAGQADPFGGTAAYLVEPTVTTASISESSTYPERQIDGETKILFSFWAKSVAATDTLPIIFRNSGNPSGTGRVDVDITNEWKRYAVLQPDVVSGNENTVEVGVGGWSTLGPGTDFYFYGAQYEVCRRSSDYRTDPGEYIYTNGARASGPGPVQIPWLVYQPALTNMQLYSREPDNAAWANNASVTVAYDRVGIDGTPNGAATLTSTNSPGLVRQNHTSVAGVYTGRVWIAKDTDQTRYPLIDLIRASSGGVFLDTQTGYAWGRPTSLPDNFEVVDEGDWWVVYLEFTVGAGSDFACRIFPAGTATLDGDYEPITGSCGFGQLDLFEGRTIAEVRGSGPIFTAGAAGSTDAIAYSFDLVPENHPNDEAAYYLELKRTLDAAVFYAANSINQTSTLRWGSDNDFGTRSGLGPVGGHRTKRRSDAVYLFSADVGYKAGVAYSLSDDQTTTVVEGVDGPTEGFYARPYQSWTLFGSTSVVDRMRNIQNYATTGHDEAKGIIDDLMAGNVPGGGGGGSVLDMDDDGLPDTPIIGAADAGGINISQDADSVNLDVNNDGVADVVIPKPNPIDET